MSKRFVIIAVTVCCLGFALPQRVHAGATLGVSPSTSSMTVGASKTVALYVNSGGVAINASQGTLSFPADKLQVTSIAKASTFKYWTVEPTYSNGNGTVTFAGGVPSPGYKGSGGSIITVTFKAKAVGTATLRFTSGLVLANDGEGTNVLTGYGSGTITIAKAATVTPTEPEPEPVASPQSPVVSSPSHPKQSSWYAKADAEIRWTTPTGVTGVSYILDQKPTTTPDDSLEANTGSQTFVDIPDGVWYVHVRGRTSTGWVPTTHFRVQVDTTSPNDFAPVVTREGGNANPSPVITFSATDATSGIAEYTFTLDSGKSVSATSPVKLERLPAGLHQFTVRATDKAGNSRDAIGQIMVEGSPAPRITSVPRSVTLFGEIPVEGLAVDGDTVVLYVDSKEVGRFVAKDAQIQPVPGVAVPEGLVMWRYTVRPMLTPGGHELTAIAINRYEVSSAPSTAVRFSTVGSSVQFFGLVLPSVVLIFCLLAIIFILIILLIILYERYRHWRRQQDFDLDAAEAEIDEEIEKLQGSLDRDISGAIRTALTDKSIQAAAHDQVKRDLVQTRQRIDALLAHAALQAAVKKKKRKK